MLRYSVCPLLLKNDSSLIYGLNSCFYDNCDKKIIIKEKEGKRLGKKNVSFTRLEPGTFISTSPSP